MRKDNYRKKKQVSRSRTSNNVGALGIEVDGQELGSGTPGTRNDSACAMGCNVQPLRIVLATGDRNVGRQPATLLLCLTFARKENEIGRAKGWRRAGEGAKYTPGQIYRRLRKSRRVTEYPTYNSCNRARVDSLLGRLYFAFLSFSLSRSLSLSRARDSRDFRIGADVADAFARASHSSQISPGISSPRRSFFSLSINERERDVLKEISEKLIDVASSDENHFQQR